MSFLYVQMYPQDQAQEFIGPIACNAPPDAPMVLLDWTLMDPRFDMLCVTLVNVGQPSDGTCYMLVDLSEAPQFPDYLQGAPLGYEAPPGTSASFEIGPRRMRRYLRLRCNMETAGQSSQVKWRIAASLG